MHRLIADNGKQLITPHGEADILWRVFLLSSGLALVGFGLGFLFPGASRSFSNGKVLVMAIRAFGFLANASLLIVLVRGKKSTPLLRTWGIVQTLFNFVLVYLSGIVFNDRLPDSLLSFMMLPVHVILLQLFTRNFYLSIVSSAILMVLYVFSYLLNPRMDLIALIDPLWFRHALPLGGLYLLFFFLAISLITQWVNHHLYRNARKQSSLMADIAYHDQETQLPNLRKLESTLRAVLEDTERNQGHLVVVGMKLTGFDSLKARLGYQAAHIWLLQFVHELRAQIGETLAEAGRVRVLSEPPLYRVDDDMFMLAAELARQGSDHESTDLIEAMRTKTNMALLRQPHGESIGFLGTFKVLRRTDKSPRTLIRSVVSMLHQAPAKALFNFVHFDEHLWSEQQRRNRLIEDINSRDFDLALRTAFQPKHRTDDGLWTGFEALARWHHPEYGEISPAEFIPLVEQAFKIGVLTDVVLGQSIALCKRLLADGRSGFRVAFNLSPLLASQSYLRHLEEKIRESGVAACLELELTEGSHLAYSPEIQSAFDRLRALGMHFTIDDFGTGYSNMAWLQGFEADSLKIDRSFVAGIPLDSRSCTLVRAVLQVAGTFGMNCVAEGVETKEQLAWLREAGCPMVQGFIHAPALESGAAPEYPPPVRPAG